MRKHAKSHATKRIKEENIKVAAAAAASAANVDTNTQNSENTTSSTDNIIIQQNTQHTMPQQQIETQTICLPNVTIHVSDLLKTPFTLEFVLIYYKFLCRFQQVITPLCLFKYKYLIW